MKKLRKSFKAVSELTSEIVFRLGAEKYSGFITAFMSWKEVVGELLASHSHPFRLENKTLLVAVRNNTWMQELVLLKPRIITQYKSILEDGIGEIVFLISSPKRKCKKS